MKIWIDHDLCAGSGTCVEICPGIFALRDEVAVTRINDEEDVPEEFEEACREVAKSCPSGAVWIEE